MIMKAAVKIVRSSGLTLMPSVSSSKNLSKPAPCAGIGADLSLFFFLLMLNPLHDICLRERFC